MSQLPRGDGGADMVNALGAVNALRTGNVVLDMIIAMTIPVIFKGLFDFMAQVKDKIQRGDWRFDMLFFWRKMIERVIEHKATSNLFGETITDRDTRNNVLLKAIELFLHHKKIKWDRSRVSLTSKTQNNRPWWWGDDDDERSPAGKLKKYQLSQKAPNYVWQPLGVYGGKPIQVGSSSSSNQTAPLLAIEDGKPDLVELRIEEDEQDKGEKGEKTINLVKYRFRSYSGHAIDGFIDEAYQWYLDELKKEDDNSRYLYEMQLKGGGSSGESAGVRSYKRYKLSDDKSFESLFFDEKKDLLALLKHFTNKTGKYAVKGYPHKLGLLLHGPPGTGKTSLIKVMAQHLQRSIVNVPLARITTNQELMDMMFDQQYMVEGEEVPIKLGFKDVIFSMEDVDAASKVVQRRDGKTTASVTQTEVVEAPLPKTGWEILLESNDGECRELVKLLMEKSPKLKTAALESKTVCNLAKQLVAPPGLGLLLSAGSSNGESDDKPREEAKTKVDQLCEQREVAQKYVKEFASSIKALIDAGTVPDDKLADELLGLGSVGKLSPYLKKSSAGYGAGEEVKATTDDEEEDTGSGGGLDMNLFMGQLASVMSSNPGKGGPGSDMMGATSAFGSSYDSKKDKLNLSGLLNVLDGVVDTPQRVLIMTTNHPEMLDPALIRPGRIDKKILLGFMSEVHAANMIDYYFQAEMGTKQRDRLHAAIMGSDEKGIPAMNLTPAQIEQFCAEYDDVDNLIANLENMAQPNGVSRILSAPLSATPKGGAGKGPGPRPALTRATSKTISFDD